MDWLLFAVIGGFPILALLAAAGYAYRDAPNYDMNPQKWAVVSFFVPFFGFFAYLFERDERKPDTSNRDEMFVDGPFEIHKSRADDVPWATASDEESEEDERQGDDS